MPGVLSRVRSGPIEQPETHARERTDGQSISIGAPSVKPTQRIAGRWLLTRVEGPVMLGVLAADGILRGKEQTLGRSAQGPA
jgi:hypothetical protein